MAKFYVVATPIGNLGDITLRALRVLKEVDVILCEDTRVTKKLLASYDISYDTLTSYHAQSGEAKTVKIIELLREGKDLALVSDAGTPAISDPGARLISRVREELPDVEVVAIPGPSALTAALSVAGVPASEFLFLGFLPHKKGRETLFKEIADPSAGGKRTVVFYESPHRILRTLERLSALLPEERKVVVVRELTKIHEEALSGDCSSILEQFRDNPEKVRGEFVVVVH